MSKLQEEISRKLKIFKQNKKKTEKKKNNKHILIRLSHTPLHAKKAI